MPTSTLSPGRFRNGTNPSAFPPAPLDGAPAAAPGSATKMPYGECAATLPQSTSRTATVPVPDADPAVSRYRSVSSGGADPAEGRLGGTVLGRSTPCKLAPSAAPPTAGPNLDLRADARPSSIPSLPAAGVSALEPNAPNVTVDLFWMMPPVASLSLTGVARVERPVPPPVATRYKRVATFLLMSESICDISFANADTFELSFASSTTNSARSRSAIPRVASSSEHTLLIRSKCSNFYR